MTYTTDAVRIGPVPLVPVPASIIWARQPADAWAAEITDALAAVLGASSLAEALAIAAEALGCRLRSEAAGRRWRELSSWTVCTIETPQEQQSLLNVGLREGWRIIVMEVPRGSSEGVK